MRKFLLIFCLWITTLGFGAEDSSEAIYNLLDARMSGGGGKLAITDPITLIDHFILYEEGSDGDLVESKAKYLKASLAVSPIKKKGKATSRDMLFHQTRHRCLPRNNAKIVSEIVEDILKATGNRRKVDSKMALIRHLLREQTVRAVGTLAASDKTSNLGIKPDPTVITAISEYPGCLYADIKAQLETAAVLGRCFLRGELAKEKCYSHPQYQITLSLEIVQTPPPGSTALYTLDQEDLLFEHIKEVITALSEHLDFYVRQEITKDHQRGAGSYS
jgi:hypothetical protein